MGQVALKAPHPQRMVLYTRVSTEEQAASGLGLESQQHQLERAAEYHGWEIVDLIRDEGASGKDLNRPGLYRALEAVAAGEADGIAVAKLDRLTRSVIDFGELLLWLQDAEAALVALDLQIDTSTASGHMVAVVLVAVAQWERDTIADRTRDGLAAKRARGESIGRPALTDRPELVERILEMRQKQAMTLQGIADVLNTEGVPTARGGTTWRPSSVASAAGWKRRPKRRKPSNLPDPRRTR